MNISEITKILSEKELKITPQRIAVLNALNELYHPTAEKVIDYIKVNYPNIAIGTVYKILETYVEKGIIQKVKTEKDIMCYDAVLDKHHHLYSSNSEHMQDYFDEELDKVLLEYFEKKKIPGFRVEDIKLQIIGKFTK
jgi:Fur family peroxide stress response transcriptional regulator